MRKNYTCSDDMHERCANNALCHLCDGIRLFKDPVAEKKEKLRIREEKKQAEKTGPLKIHRAEKKEGMAFEKQVVKQWNEKFSGKKKKTVAKPRLDLTSTIDEAEEKQPIETTPLTPRPLQSQRNISTSSQPKPEAKRQANSGAMWHAKGDVVLEHALLECKERGTVSAKGEKQITVPKSWLEKQAVEAFQEQKPYWYLPFHYKGDEAIYIIKPFDHEMELIFELRQARQRIEALENLLDKNGDL